MRQSKILGLIVALALTLVGAFALIQPASATGNCSGYERPIWCPTTTTTAKPTTTTTTTTVKPTTTTVVTTTVPSTTTSTTASTTIPATTLPPATTVPPSDPGEALGSGISITAADPADPPAEIKFNG